MKSRLLHIPAVNYFKTFALRSVLLCLALTALISISARAQGKWGEDGEIEDAEIVIEKSRKIELPEAIRMTDKITFPIKPIVPAAQKYNYSDFRLILPDQESRVKVLTMKQDAQPVLPQAYIKLGGGNLGTFYGEGWVGSRQTDKYAWGAHLRHFSSSKGPVSNPPSGTSENRIDLYNKYFLEKITLSGNLSFGRDRYNFYGFQPADKVKADSVKQVFSTVSFNAGIENRDSSTFQYKAGLGVNTFSDAFKASETRFELNFGGRYAIDDKMGIRFTTDLMLSKYADSSSVSRNLFSIRPQWYFKNKDISIQAGANFAAENDTAKNTQRFHLYPHLNVEYTFVPQYLTGFIGITGDMRKVTLQNMATSNPWLASNQVLLHTNNMIEFFTGIRGGAGDGFRWLAELHYNNVRNLPMFINDTLATANHPDGDTSKFRIVYDRGTVSILRAGAEMGWSVSKKYDIGLRLDYYNYAMVQQNAPWHLPTFKTTLTAGIWATESLRFSTGLYVMQGITAPAIHSDLKTELPAIVDWDLKAEYLFAGKWSAWLEADNILSQKNQRYLNYSTRPLLVMGGLTYSF
ncbi:MAG: hypothetical protein V4543_15030 [Bacteroidota bacterium]